MSSREEFLPLEELAVVKAITYMEDRVDTFDDQKRSGFFPSNVLLSSVPPDQQYRRVLTCV